MMNDVDDGDADHLFVTLLLRLLLSLENIELKSLFELMKMRKQGHVMLQDCLDLSSSIQS